MDQTPEKKKRGRDRVGGRKNEPDIDGEGEEERQRRKKAWR